jgi:hypothetical protein
MSLSMVIERAKCTLRQNLAKDGDEAKTVAVLKVRGAVVGSVLDKFGAGETVSWASMLWDEDGQVRTLGVSELNFDYSAESMRVEINDDTLTAKKMDIVATVSHVKARPVFGGHAEITFRLTWQPDPQRLRFLWNLPALPWAVITVHGSVHDGEVELRNNISAIG